MACKEGARRYRHNGNHLAEKGFNEGSAGTGIGYGSDLYDFDAFVANAAFNEGVPLGEMPMNRFQASPPFG
ncbi:hypothetical protein [Peribacillus muralis]|uniref:hypothetical protein n=1 Tax=Peribacillus muralis TaxID=264697 RepID=UPI0021489BDE|nr:hypothetical protein [Peribacillus muralis]